MDGQTSKIDFDKIFRMLKEQNYSGEVQIVLNNGGIRAINKVNKRFEQINVNQFKTIH